MTGVRRLLDLPAFRNALLLRGLVLWVALRIGAAFLDLVVLNPAQSLLVVLAAAAAVTIDARRRDEDLFLANLCIPARAIFPVAAAPPLSLEVVAWLVVQLVAGPLR